MMQFSGERITYGLFCAFWYYCTEINYFLQYCSYLHTTPHGNKRNKHEPWNAEIRSRWPNSPPRHTYFRYRQVVFSSVLLMTLAWFRFPSRFLLLPSFAAFICFFNCEELRYLLLSHRCDQQSGDWWLFCFQCWQCLRDLRRRLSWSFPEISEEGGLE